jgi:predicted RNA-binding protein with PUA-like domain
MDHWLLKADPDDYGFADLERDKTTVWTGVHNPAALGHMRLMKKGDAAFIYHTGDEKQIVGLADVVKPAYPDPGEKDEKLVVVDLKAKGRLKRPVTLAEIKADKAFAEFHLVRVPRLSVMPVPPALWQKLLMMGGS